MDDLKMIDNFKNINNICENIKDIFVSFKDTINDKEIKINSLQNELKTINFEESNFTNFSIIKQQDKENKQLKNVIEDLKKKIYKLEQKLKYKKEEKEIKKEEKEIKKEEEEIKKEEEEIKKEEKEIKKEEEEIKKEEEEIKKEEKEIKKEEKEIKKKKKNKIEKLDIKDLKIIDYELIKYYKSNLNFIYEISNDKIGRKLGKYKKATNTISFY